MNKERLEMLAKHLEKLPRKEFDMGHWCGTACCIGGYIEKLFGLPENGRIAVARDVVGLNPVQANQLFFGETSAKATPQQAASVVRHLKDTGKVEWEKFVNG